MTVFLILFILTLFVVELFSIKAALKGISYDYTFSKQLIEAEETTELISSVTNESRRFVPFVRMVESLPTGTRPINENVFIRKNSMGLDYLHYDSTLYLMSRSRLKRTLALTFKQRGRYVFGGANLRGGDFLGINEKRKDFKQLKELIVYPKLIRTPALEQIIGGFIGDVSVRRFIMEDPILTIGTRPYTGKEPLKQLSWKHTARTNQMMVKQYDYTTEMIVTVFLDISVAAGITTTFEQMEAAYGLARTVMTALNNKKIPFEFITNAKMNGRDEQISPMSSNLGPQHMRYILELLGRGSYETHQTYEQMLVNMAEGQHSQNRSTVIIMPAIALEKERMAQQLLNQTSGPLLFLHGETVVEEGEHGVH